MQVHQYNHHNSNNISSHEAKAMPQPIEQTKIVSAYGLRRCPKLIEQLSSSSSLAVRTQALTALCDEMMMNPYHVYGCVEAGAVRILAVMISDTDYHTRYYASKALAMIAKDANGLDAILRDDVISYIMSGANDPSDEVRYHVYDCIYHITRTADGVDMILSSSSSNDIQSSSTASSSIIKVLVEAIKCESGPIKCLLLPAIYNIAGNDIGLRDILSYDGIKVCVSLLSSSSSSYDDKTIIYQASRSLGFLCYDERGKREALTQGAIRMLINVLYMHTHHHNTSSTKSSSSSSYKMMIASLLMALSSISSCDDGKKQCYDDDDHHHLIICIIMLICDDDRLVRLNALKVVSNIAVYPSLRNLMINKEHHIISSLQMMMDDDKVVGQDKLLRRHLEIALNAVTWKP